MINLRSRVVKRPHQETVAPPSKRQRSWVTPDPGTSCYVQYIDRGRKQHVNARFTADHPGVESMKFQNKSDNQIIQVRYRDLRVLSPHTQIPLHSLPTGPLIHIMSYAKATDLIALKQTYRAMQQIENNDGKAVLIQELHNRFLAHEPDLEQMTVPQLLWIMKTLEAIDERYRLKKHQFPPATSSSEVRRRSANLVKDLIKIPGQAFRIRYFLRKINRPIEQRNLIHQLINDLHRYKHQAPHIRHYINQHGYTFEQNLDARFELMHSMERRLLAKLILIPAEEEQARTIATGLFNEAKFGNSTLNTLSKLNELYQIINQTEMRADVRRELRNWAETVAEEGLEEAQRIQSTQARMTRILDITDALGSMHCLESFEKEHTINTVMRLLPNLQNQAFKGNTLDRISRHVKYFPELVPNFLGQVQHTDIPIQRICLSNAIAQIPMTAENVSLLHQTIRSIQEPHNQIQELIKLMDKIMVSPEENGPDMGTKLEIFNDIFHIVGLSTGAIQDRIKYENLSRFRDFYTNDLLPVLRQRFQPGGQEV